MDFESTASAIPPPGQDPSEAGEICERRLLCQQQRDARSRLSATLMNAAWVRTTGSAPQKPPRISRQVVFSRPPRAAPEQRSAPEDNPAAFLFGKVPDGRANDLNFGRVKNDGALCAQHAKQLSLSLRQRAPYTALTRQHLDARNLRCHAQSSGPLGVPFERRPGRGGAHPFDVGPAHLLCGARRAPKLRGIASAPERSPQTGVQHKETER